MDEVMIRLMTKYLLTVFPVSRIKYGRRFKRGVNVDGHSFLLPGSSVSLKVKIYDSLKKCYVASDEDINLVIRRVYNIN
jgi:hypothetical protein